MRCPPMAADLIAGSGGPRSSGERCFWKVHAWDGRGVASAWSAAVPMPTLRRRCCARNSPMSRPVVMARLYLCGLGLYELSINGARAGDRVLDPALTDYRERVPPSRTKSPNTCDATG